jgi:hypothetical protein
MSKPKGYWTKEICVEEGKKYSTKKDFRKNSRNIYDVSIKHGWISEVCSHMIPLRKPSEFWSFEDCKKEGLKYDSRCEEEALKYNSRYEFRKKCESAYDAARKHNYLNEICGHMKPFKNIKDIQ